MDKLPAAISIDVDSLWVVARSIGRTIPLSDTSIYTQAIPEFLSLLDDFSAKATFFCVGQDLTFNDSREIVTRVEQHGHEVANHTMNHPHNWTTLNPADKLREIVCCHQVLKEAGVESAAGFRSSGYYLDESLVSGLRLAGYTYDSSVLPSLWVPLLMSMGRTFVARSIRHDWKYGHVRYGLTSLSPYLHNANTPRALMELPISCVPKIRLPFHSTFVFALGRWLFELGIRAIQRRQLPLVYVFHAVDLVDEDIGRRLKNYVTTRIPYERRLRAVRSMIARITSEFRVVTCAQLAREYKLKSQRSQANTAH